MSGGMGLTAEQQSPQLTPNGLHLLPDRAGLNAEQQK